MSLLQLNTRHRSAAPGTVRQTVKLLEDMSGTNGGTKSGTITGVVAGSTIVVFIGNHNPSAQSVCSDGQGTYTADSYTGSHPDSAQSFHLTNANSGSHTIQLTNTNTFYVVWVIEISAATVNSFDVGASQFQLTPSNVTDGATSGNFTTTQANDLIVGFEYSGSGPFAAGTGFTSLGSSTGGGQFPSRVEWKTVAGAQAWAATFSNPTSSVATAGSAFKHP